MIESIASSQLSQLLLPIWLMFVVILQKMAPAIIHMFIKLVHGASQEERTLGNKILASKKELHQMSMSSDYVKYVKLERQILKSEQQLKPLVEQRKQSQGYAQTSLNTVMYIFLGLLFAITMYGSYAKGVVENLNQDWFYPFGYVIGLPTGSTTSIGVPFFLLTFRTFLSSFEFS